MYFFCWFWSCLTNVLNVCIGLVQKSLLGKGMVSFDLHVRRGSDVETSFYKLPRSPWARQNALLCLTLCALNCIVALTSWICQFSANYSRKAALVNVPIIIHSFIYHTICAFSIFFYQVRISFYKSAMLHWTVVSLYKTNWLNLSFVDEVSCESSALLRTAIFHSMHPH